MAKKASKAAAALADLAPPKGVPYDQRIDPATLEEIREALASYRDTPRHKRPSKADVARALVSAYDLPVNPNHLASKLPELGWPS